VDTRSPRAVAAGITAAFDLLGKPGDDERVTLARDLVADRFTIQAMAGTLAGIYLSVAAPVPG
jgi:hypothetical protein